MKDGAASELRQLTEVWRNVCVEIAAGRLALSPDIVRKINLVRTRIAALRSELQ